MTGSLKDRLRALLAEEAYLTGDFVLTSGKHSNHYFDCKRVTFHPEGLAAISDLLVAKMHVACIYAIGGLTLGADPIVAGVVDASWRLGCPIEGFVIRKEPKKHGTSEWIEGVVPEDTRVAVVDDVVTSGGSIIKAVERCRSEGLDPVIAYAIVDREEGGAETIERDCGIPFESLFKYSEIIEPE